MDSDTGNRMKFRYNCNEKGSLNEEGCEDYVLLNIMGPAAAATGALPRSQIITRPTLRHLL